MESLPFDYCSKTKYQININGDAKTLFYYLTSSIFFNHSSVIAKTNTNKLPTTSNKLVDIKAYPVEIVTTLLTKYSCHTIGWIPSRYSPRSYFCLNYHLGTHIHTFEIKATCNSGKKHFIKKNPII